LEGTPHRLIRLSIAVDSLTETQDRKLFPAPITVNMAGTGKTFVVEHLDPELEEWSSLEYSSIASESHASGAQFLLSSVPTSLKLPANLQGAKGLNVETRGIEEIYADKKDRVCLLDPAASKDLCPEDGETFDIFLFGGILGKHVVLRLYHWQV
jgi:ribosome biogenesis SPOUT family RNA methylase Rps3